MSKYSKQILSVIFLLVFIGFSIPSAQAQEWGTVEKTKETVEVGNRVFFAHKIVKGNTFYSISKVYGVSVEEIKAANPELNGELKLGAILLIPKGTIEGKSVVEPLKVNTGVAYENYFYHVVKQGESVYGIAKIYGVKVADLLATNQMQESAISPGFHLKIPEIKMEDVPLIVTQSKPKTTTSKPLYFEHPVKEKETLFSIAKEYGIGVETLKYINSISTSSIHPGQIILVPLALQNKEASDQKKYIIHIVQPKEGLYGIARKYGLNIEQLMAINPGLSTDISIGQEIKISRNPNEKGYIEHEVVEKKEKLADIAREYEISLDNLKEMNPSASTKIRKGETIFIPLDFVDNQQKTEPKLVELEAEEHQNNRPNFEYSDQVFNVALMLPLYLSDVDSLLTIEDQELVAKKDQIRALEFIEFYEGAQIAVDSMKQLGMKLNFQVYDVPNNELETSLTLQNRALLDADLIISLLYSKSFGLVAEFSKEQHIPLINVLSTRGQIIYNNPYVVKMSPKPNGLYTRIADFVGNHFADYNTIIVRNNPYQLTSQYEYLSSLLQEKVQAKAPLPHAKVIQKVDEYMEGKPKGFADVLKKELSKGDSSVDLNKMIANPFDTTWVNNPIKTVVYSADSLGGIMKDISLFRKNLIVALGSDQVFAIELFTKLNFVRDSIDLRVIGAPDWHEFINLDVDYSQPFSLRVLSQNFVDYNNPATQQFVNKFYRNYLKDPEVDKYAFLGYDATFYFLQALYKYGKNFLKEIPNFQTPLLENQLQFEKIENGGYENVYWNIYRQENYQYLFEK